MPSFEVVKDLGTLPYMVPFSLSLRTVLKNIGTVGGQIDVEYGGAPSYVRLPNRYQTSINAGEVKEIVDRIEYLSLSPNSFYSDIINAVFTPVGTEQENIVVRFNPRFRTGPRECRGLGTEEATNDPKQRKIHYMAGRYWCFYSNSTQICYLHSGDAVNWSGPIGLYGEPLRPIPYGFRFDTYYDGTYIHLVFADFSSIYYVRGIPNTDGTISFGPVNYVDGAHIQTISVSVDSGGYPWIAIDDLDQGAMKVYKSSRNDGTWETAPGFPHTLESGMTYPRATILSAPNGRMISIWLTHNQQVRASVWHGSSWGVTKLSTYNIADGATMEYGVVVDGSVAHIVYRSTEGVTFESFNSDTETFENLLEDVTMGQPDLIRFSVGMITLDAATGDVYVSWMAGPEDNILLMRRRRDSSGVWGPPSTIGSTQNIPILCRPTQSHLVTPAGIGYAWIVRLPGGELDLIITFVPV
ncbi:MAG: hypothetical protein QXW52_09190 [Candidatus Caldarchaeum sp.]